MATCDYLIVGAGVFGASTAYHLAKIHPEASVVLIDRTAFPCKAGASWDWNKLIRSDYANPLYMAKANEAMEVWRNDPIFKDFYHETGLVWVDDLDILKTICSNNQKLPKPATLELADPGVVKKLYRGIFEDADYQDTERILINKTSGYADAEKALERVIQTACKLGVEYMEATVSCVLFDEQGTCTGAKFTNGDVVHAKHVVLSTGANTAKILLDSTSRESMHLGNRMTAAAILTGLVKLTPEEASLFKEMPSFVHHVGPTQGGCIALNADNELKFWRDVSFTNSKKHPSGKVISTPPNASLYKQWDVSDAMKVEVDLVNKGIFGSRGKHFQLHDHRICWDAITPSQDFIICPHPHSTNLYVASGGSFHSWKFLPTLGKYVVQMMDGILDKDLQTIWAWDRDNNTTAHHGLLPKRELRDLI